MSRDNAGDAGYGTSGRDSGGARNRGGHDRGRSNDRLSSNDRNGKDRRDSHGRQRNRQAVSRRQFSSAKPSQRNRGTDPARLAAFRTLRAVSADDAYGNLVLPEQIRRLNVNRRDAALATELAYGALRQQGTWDAILTRCVDRPLKKIDPPVLDALRLGVHQVLAMRIPDHAAIDQTVGLTRSEIGAGPSGLVNAVLRKVLAKSQSEWLEELTRDVDEITRFSLRGAHPVWIVRAFRQALTVHGRKAGELADLLAADNAAPRVHLVALPQLGEIDTEIEHGAEPSTLVPGAAISPGGDLHRSEQVRAGTVRVQDAGSQLVARSVATAAPVRSGERWLDLCAGPGGKAALLAAEAARHGAHLLANEVAEHRADLVRQALEVVPKDAWTVRAGDGREISAAEAAAEADEKSAAASAGESAEPGEPGFDRVLVDAPCTGLGALRRRPEARWRRTPQDLAELTVLQSELLTAAANALKPGGLLVYATCSPHAAETAVAVDDLLRSRSDLTLVDAAGPVRSAALPGALDNDADPAKAYTGPHIAKAEHGAATVQLWPHVHGTDAMFIAHFRKNRD